MRCQRGSGLPTDLSRKHSKCPPARGPPATTPDLHDGLGTQSPVRVGATRWASRGCGWRQRDVHPPNALTNLKCSVRHFPPTVTRNQQPCHRLQFCPFPGLHGDWSHRDPAAEQDAFAGPPWRFVDGQLVSFQRGLTVHHVDRPRLSAQLKGPLHCSPVWPITNETAMNICVKVSVWPRVVNSLGSIPRSVVPLSPRQRGSCCPPPPTQHSVSLERFQPFREPACRSNCRSCRRRTTLLGPHAPKRFRKTRKPRQLAQGKGKLRSRQGRVGSSPPR